MREVQATDAKNHAAHLPLHELMSGTIRQGIDRSLAAHDALTKAVISRSPITSTSLDIG